MKIRHLLSAVAVALSFAAATPAYAHCDTLDGPVVSAARDALDKGDVRLVLGWVRGDDEAAVRSAFERALAVRAHGEEARSLADTYFFETLVRVHRAGEGAPYTGLKAAGEIEPAIAAADRALAAGRPQEVAHVLEERIHRALHGKFAAAAARAERDPQDVQAGRAYVQAYVDYVHFVERVYQAAGDANAAHAH